MLHMIPVLLANAVPKDNVSKVVTFFMPPPGIGW